MRKSPDAGRPPRVLLTATTNAFEAHVILARLRSEGLDPELRGAVATPYPFTVGGMGEVQIYVAPDEMDDARLVLLAGEVDSSVGEPVTRRTTTRADVAVVLGAAAVLVLVTLGRVVGLAVV